MELFLDFGVLASIWCNPNCRAGLPGRTCLLRAVCEASEWPMAEGLLGNLLTVLLT